MLGFETDCAFSNKGLTVMHIMREIIRGGVMVNPFYKTNKWKAKREKILKRDSFLCLECKRFGRTKAATTVHHANPLEHWPELALINWNLVSLCGVCHDKMHNRITDELTELGEFWRNKVTPPP